MLKLICLFKRHCMLKKFYAIYIVFFKIVSFNKNNNSHKLIYNIFIDKEKTNSYNICVSQN